MKNFKSLFLIGLGFLLTGFISCDFTSKDTNRGPIVLGDPSTIVTETNPKFIEDTIQDLELMDSELDLQPTEPVEDPNMEQQISKLDQQTTTEVAPQKEEIKPDPKQKETVNGKSSTSKPDTHKVKSGESFYNIALKYGLTESELLKINNLTKKDARRIKPGQIIKLK